MRCRGLVMLVGLSGGELAAGEGKSEEQKKMTVFYNLGC